MSTTLATSPNTDEGTRTLGPPASVGGLLALLGSLGALTAGITASSTREANLSPLGIAGCALATAGVLLLAITVLRWQTTVPGWVTTLLGGALVMTVGQTWGYTTIIPGIASDTTDAFFDQLGNNPGLIAWFVPTILFGAVGRIALAVTGWRSGAISKPASVVLVLAGVVTLLPATEPSLILTGIAFLMLGTRRS